jgi:hypothetical protein
MNAANQAQMQEQGALGRNVLGKRLEGEQSALQFGADQGKNEFARLSGIASLGSDYDVRKQAYDMARGSLYGQLYGADKTSNAMALLNK